jgi:ParB family chromosome partitioning protein
MSKQPVELANRIIAEGLNVLQAEAMVSSSVEQVEKAMQATLQKSQKDPNVSDVEQKISQALGLNVTLLPKGTGGELRIKYKDLAQFESLLSLLQR